jgi:hypothetical protein
MAGNEGTVVNEGGIGMRCVTVGGIEGAGGGCRLRDALRALEEERGGTLPGGMLYMLEKLLSTGLSGDGVLEVRPRLLDLRPYCSVSWLFFLSGSLFSASLLSMLGRRLDRREGLRA